MTYNFDAVHEAAIDALIPAAEAEAHAIILNTGKAGRHILGVDGQPCEFDCWTQEFHRAMKRLTLAAGLRSC